MTVRETCSECRTKDDADKLLWLALRRGLLMIVRAIELRYMQGDERAA